MSEGNQNGDQSRKNEVSESTPITLSINLIVVIIGSLVTLGGSILYGAINVSSFVHDVNSLRDDVKEINDVVKSKDFSDMLSDYRRGNLNHTTPSNKTVKN